MVEDREAAGVGGHDPEDRLSVPAELKETVAAADGDGACGRGDVRGEDAGSSASLGSQVEEPVNLTRT